MFFESFRDQCIYYSRRDNHCLMHFHHSSEVIYIVRGTKTAFVNGDEYLLKEGDVLVCPPYSLHSFSPSEDGEQIVATLPAELCVKFEEKVKNCPPDSLCVHDNSGEYLQLMEALKEPSNSFILEGLVQCLLGIFLRDCTFLKKDRSPSQEIATKVAEYIDEHYQSPITLEALARQFGYSPSYFSVLFHRIFRMGITQYVNAIRVRKSIPLLSEKKISSVYFLCGFQSPQQYFLNFKRLYGCSPKDYLKQAGMYKQK